MEPSSSDLAVSAGRGDLATSSNGADLADRAGRSDLVARADRMLLWGMGVGVLLMLQPFWALALLGITGLKARQIIGYTAVVMVLSSGIFLAALMVF